MSDSFALLEKPRRPWLDPEELKESFHRLTAAVHPDRTGDSGPSADLNAAYAMLRDPASRVKHLLELEHPEALRQPRDVPPSLGEVFMRLATLRRTVDAFVEQRSNVSTPLAQALLASERFTLRRDLEKEIAAVEATSARALDRLRRLDHCWPDGAAETYGDLVELHQELTYLGKWTWNLREALFRLDGRRPFMNASLIAGIDLGTTNSLIGVMEAGFPILLADADGRRLTPSTVYFPETGEPVVGWPAERQRALEPEQTVSSVKRYMGRRVGEEPAPGTYRLAGQPGGPVKVALRGKEWAPEEISALVLRKLKADAEAALGQEVQRAVITVPAYFNDAQRQATKRAGELAGFTVERIVNEPTAAALAYGLDRLTERSKIAVYDLGGGTFDISILELNAGVFQVLATSGNTRLGGDDLDAALVEHLRAQAAEVGGESGIATARLREAAVEAKHRLSSEERVEIVIPFLHEARSLSVTLDRAALERIARPIVEKTRVHCLRALADARLTPADLQEVILVGGQTRMPLVRAFVEELFGRAPNLSQNPDEAVALGATIQAGILSGAVQQVLLLDVTPLSLGIETFGGLMNVIIPRNTTIPCKAGEMFTNAVAGQVSMLIRVLQGEREMARDNWELGRFALEFQPAPKGQARVGVQFEVDANGILHVLARDTKTGAEQVVEVSSAVDVSDEAVEKMLEDSLEHAFEDVNERIFTEAKLKADELLPAVRRALDRVGDELPPEERERIETCARAVEAAVAQGAAPPLKKANADLDEATQRLAAMLIERATRGG